MSERVTSTLLGIVKNEGPYIIEWIAYHKVIGFDRLVIYDNESSDGSSDILRKLGDVGEIEYVAWPWPADRRIGPQIPAYQDGVARLAGRTEWLGILDADEFLVLKQHDRVNAFLAAYPSVTGLAVHWNIFGSNDFVENDGRPVIERFTRCGGDQRFVAKHIKSLVRLDAVVDVFVHYFVVREGLYINTGWQPVRPAPVQDDFTHEGAQINHYFTKSFDEWKIKQARGKADRPVWARDKFRPDHQWTVYDLNDREDTTILGWLPQTRAEMTRLLGLVR